MDIRNKESSHQMLSALAPAHSGYSNIYNVRAGRVTAIVIFVCSVASLLIGAAILFFEPKELQSGLASIGGLLGGLLGFPVAGCGIKTKSRKRCWILTYMVMSILYAVFAPVLLTYGLYAAVKGIPGAAPSMGALGVILMIIALVDLCASIVASAYCCRGYCNCCLIPSIPGVSPPDLYRRLEDETEPNYEVCPDVDGLYTDWKVTKAQPTTTDFDPSENYVLHRSVTKGLALIVNNYSFRKERKGSEVDLANVQHVFKEIGYYPIIRQNLTANGIRETVCHIVDRINREGPEGHNSLVVVLMSHGGLEGIYGTDEQIVRLKEIQDQFTGRNCPALVDRPKIFFIQACRGHERTKSALDTDSGSWMDPNTPSSSGVDSCSTHDLTPVSHTNLPSTSTTELEPDWDIPDNADMYVAYATSPGYFSLRDNVNGSWFIQALCEELIASVHVDDLDTMMTRVTRRVTGKTGYLPDGKGGQKKILQTPHISKQGIRKKIYFYPKYPPRQTDDIPVNIG